MSVKTITFENFKEEVLECDKTVLIDFWAGWCGPCRMLSPIVDQLASENQNIVVGKINIDEQEDLASKYGVMSIPTLLVFKNGEVVNKAVGVISKNAMMDLVK